MNQMSDAELAEKLKFITCMNIEQAEAIGREAGRRLSAPAPAVPREPTGAMLRAGAATWTNEDYGTHEREIWRAMWDAAHQRRAPLSGKSCAVTLQHGVTVSKGWNRSALDRCRKKYIETPTEGETS